MVPSSLPQAPALLSGCLLNQQVKGTSYHCEDEQRIMIRELSDKKVGKQYTCNHSKDFFSHSIKKRIAHIYTVIKISSNK